MARRNYVVMLSAPISCRVAARNKGEAVKLAVKWALGLDRLTVGLENDGRGAWLEDAPWSLASDEVDGGCYPSEVQPAGTAAVNGRRP